MAERPTTENDSTAEDDSLALWDDEHEAAIQQALHAVNLPPGLLGRLQSAVSAQLELRHAAASRPAPEVGSPSSAPSLQTDLTSLEAEVLLTSALLGPDNRPSPVQVDERVLTTDPQAESGIFRRSVLVLAVAAAISGFAFLARQWTLPAEKSWLTAQSNVILEKVEQDNPANWRVSEHVSLMLPPSVQAQLARVAVVGERSLSDFGVKNRGTIYWLDSGDGVGLFLLRIQALPTIRGLTSRFEILPTPSGGWSLAALNVGDETFVLAAACTKEQMFNYIKRPDVT